MFNFNMLVCTAVAALAGLAIVTPATAQVVKGEEHCVVNVRSSDVLNVRANASASSKIVTKLPYGQCGIVLVNACRGAWCPIEDGHSVGWVNSEFISMMSPAMYCVAGVGAADMLKVRAYPSAKSRILTKLPRNQCDIAFLPYSKGNWQKVRVDGYEGWANRAYLSGQ